MEIGTISLIGGLAVTVITTVGNLWLTYVNKKKELQKELTLKVLEASLKEYEFRTTKILEESEKQGRSADIYPYDYYLIHFAQLVKLIEDDKLSEEKIKKVVQNQKLFERTYKSEQEKSETY
ncbi:MULTISPECIES: hypothetical protein [unclassified Mesobacillus]|uniref:hypothetical protein n=1 Tax=unclassified Mesobacillus TaxID=2675270 RepID=UPI00203C2D7D|nr:MULTISPECIES: hypothetical protein [unclassified Mesobacillus]MCM3122750.1 hypothetical protein [Mesobacillus sp. MER 33]MCM3232714.1 hypothetical protein [Mesobacillus sp. MER 48]